MEGPNLRLEGTFVNGQLHGTDCLKTTLDGERYMGGITNGEYEGKGKLQRADGTLYEGSFRNGAFSSPRRFFEINFEATFTGKASCSSHPVGFTKGRFGVESRTAKEQKSGQMADGLKELSEK